MQIISTILSLIKLMRPHQWTKNLLVFAPLFFSEYWNPSLAGLSAYAFVAFCLTASAVYCINDLADAVKDREHPKKKNRPIASGRISPALAVVLSVTLCVCGAFVGSHAGDYLLGVLLLYVVLQLLYTFLLKKLPIFDILTLSLSFVLRILAGAVATAVPLSTWIIICTWLISLMLATGKRLVELGKRDEDLKTTRVVLLKYSVHYLRHMISSIGAITLVCFLLWCSEMSQIGRFTPIQIFPAVIFVAFAIMRYQLMVFQKQFNEDPTIGLISDIPIVTSAACFVIYFSILMYVL